MKKNRNSQLNVSIDKVLNEVSKTNDNY